jgi:NAD-dependent deacetylase
LTGAPESVADRVHPVSTTLPPGAERKVSEIVDALRGARSVLFVTGAGVSADSGLPTYRRIGGLCSEADTVEGIPIERALSGEMMQTNPALTWKHIHQKAKAT